MKFYEFGDMSNSTIMCRKWEPNPNIRISCWYGEREMNMKKAIRHLKRVFPNLEIHPFKGLGHGEIMTQPERLVQELKAFMGR